jgi:hypothetical protein
MKQSWVTETVPQRNKCQNQSYTPKNNPKIVSSNGPPNGQSLKRKRNRSGDSPRKIGRRIVHLVTDPQASATPRPELLDPMAQPQQTALLTEDTTARQEVGIAQNLEVENSGEISNLPY